MPRIPRYARNDKYFSNVVDLRSLVDKQLKKPAGYPAGKRRLQE